MTDRYEVVGNPVAHSLSPVIHARFAAACGDLRYDRCGAPALGGQSHRGQGAASGRAVRRRRPRHVGGQAAAAFALWRGVAPSTAGVVAALREAA